MTKIKVKYIRNIEKLMDIGGVLTIPLPEKGVYDHE
jgi:hypothetical protein